ncbi:MAG: MTH1187 family thiamine-binding protein, partial [Nitrosopumilaceae archaeon]
GTTSLGEYIAKGVSTLNHIDGIKYQVTPMGTLLESENIDKIFDASKAVMNEVFKTGVKRVEVILKIDERHDKIDSLEDKLESVKRRIKS